MAERLIKSSNRVREHGEVFTPRNIVLLMLNQNEIQPALNSLSSTFLEPAAGEGAFLTEVLSRKLELANKVSQSIQDFENNSLIALTSLYGIELLVDNTELLVMHMYQVFHQKYLQQLSRYHSSANKKVEKSAITIIRANMAQGDALTGKDKIGNDIVFSQWNLLPVLRGVRKIQRIEYTLDAIKNNGRSLDGQAQGHGTQEISLFETDESKEKKVVYKYSPVTLQNIYKEDKIPITKED